MDMDDETIIFLAQRLGARDSMVLKLFEENDYRPTELNPITESIYYARQAIDRLYGASFLDFGVTGRYTLSESGIRALELADRGQI